MRELLDAFSAAARQQAETDQLVTVLAQFFDFHPLPAWIKIVDVGGQLRMFRTNTAYQIQTGKNYAQGSQDEDLWDAETSSDFNENDKRAIATRSVVETKEVAENAAGEQVLWAGAKWPIFNAVGDVIAVAGFAIAEPMVDGDE